MKGKFDVYGVLHIKRSIAMIRQFCPYSVAADPCGHWCPLMQEIITPPKANITLCNNVTLIFNEFIDERI